MTLQRRILALAVGCALPLAAAADTALTVYSSARPGSVDPHVFNSGGNARAVPGYALVRETRPMALVPGRNAIRLSDIPALIDPTTVAFSSLTHPGTTRVVEQSFEFDLTSTAKLLSRYLERDIAVEVPRGDAVETVNGTLLGIQGGLTLKQPDGSLRILENRSGIRLPSLPGGLISKPTLAWDIEAQAGGRHETRIAYQTGGMTWWADYNLTYAEPAPGECRLDVASWVTLVNQSGASYRDAKLKLVAGDVQRVQPPRPASRLAASAEMRMADKAQGFAEKSFFEYHLYTLGRTTTIPDNSTKQIELFPVARDVGCEKTLVYQGQVPVYFDPGAPLVERNLGIAGNRKVDVYLTLRNSAANGLGVPLPGGRLRVAKRDPADGGLEFIGEDVIDHTPRDEKVQVRLGSAFDVVGERRQVDFRIDTTAKWMEEDIEVRVRNQKPAETVRVVVRESLHRWSTWSVTRRSHEFTREDSRTIRFPVQLAPKAEAVVRYTVRYTW